jgi:hypothetical protein
VLRTGLRGEYSDLRGSEREAGTLSWLHRSFFTKKYRGAQSKRMVLVREIRSDRRT